MALSNVIFFRDPVNYQDGRITQHGTTTIISEMSDNSYSTYSSQNDIDINMENAIR